VANFKFGRGKTEKVEDFDMKNTEWAKLKKNLFYLLYQLFLSFISVSPALEHAYFTRYITLTIPHYA
jgi:hypothetical protein